MSTNQQYYDFKEGINLAQVGHLQSVLAALPKPREPLSIAIASLPRKVVLSLGQFSGAGVKPIVAPGDRVLTGQCIAKHNDNFTTQVHSSISGVVSNIGQNATNGKTGLKEMAITVESDGLDEWVQTQGWGQDFKACTPSTMIDYIRQCGIVGLGGAGFPTHIKLSRLENCHTLIVNGVECEPGVSCDQAVIQNHPEAIIKGIEILIHISGAKRAIIALRSDNTQSLVALEKVQPGPHIRFALMPEKYAAGDEKVIIKSVLGKAVPSGKHSAHSGILCQNVSTIKAIYDALIKKQPLISRVVTLTGSALKQTQNYQVRLGTIIADMPELVLKSSNQVDYFLDGLMMGNRMRSLAHGVKKTTNSIFVNYHQPLSAEQPCIRCGVCHLVCPIGLLPQQLYWYTKHGQVDKALDYRLLDCTTCQCCSAICPSHIPLGNYFIKAQALYRQQQSEQKQSDIARERFEFRDFRLERNKQEKKVQMAQKKAELQQKLATDKSQKDKIQQALERVQKKAQIKPPDRHG